MELRASRPSHPDHPCSHPGAAWLTPVAERRARLQYQVFACDYDGTLASGGAVAPDLVGALRRLTATGRKLVIVTGRRLEDLIAVFPESDLCERIVAENGAVLYTPATGGLKVLAGAPSHELIAELGRRGVRPLSTGRVVIAGDRRNEAAVREVIAELGLPVRLELNKDALMMLPEGISKASGLRAALAELSLAPANVAGIGDAENDVSLLEVCGLGIAVANALESVKRSADRVTSAANGSGVLEAIDWLLSTDS